MAGKSGLVCRAANAPNAWVNMPKTCCAALTTIRANLLSATQPLNSNPPHYHRHAALHAYPRCPEMTLKSFQGGCQTGLGHLLGNRRATAALGVYSLLPPAAVGRRALLAPVAVPFMAPCTMSCCCSAPLTLHMTRQGSLKKGVDLSHKLPVARVNWRGKTVGDACQL